MSIRDVVLQHGSGKAGSAVCWLHEPRIQKCVDNLAVAKKACIHSGYIAGLHHVMRKTEVVLTELNSNRGIDR